MSRSAARTEDVLGALAGRDESALRRLLRRRPDLTVPPPASLGALASRAVSRPSVDRALAALDQHVIEVAEAICALHPLGPVDVAAVTRGVARDPADAIATLTDLVLVVDGRPVRILAELLGPYPAGLGPPAAHLDAGRPLRHEEQELHAVLADAPADARRVLDALAAGPPVGVVGAGAAASGAQWLLDRAILHRASTTEVVLPLETALLLRAGRTHPRAQPKPPPLTDQTRPAPVVAAESARAAEEIVRLVEVVVRRWTAEPAPALQSGGLGVRELKRLADVLEVTPSTATTIVELAGAAMLIGDSETRDGAPVLAAAPAADDWLRADLAERWTLLAATWSSSRRAPWLAGSKDDRGVRRAPLDPGLARGWTARLRRRLLQALAATPAGAAPTPAELHARLTWSRPRASPPLDTVEAVLAEAELLGVTGAGALSSAGHALVRAMGLQGAGPATDDPVPDDPDLTAVAAALADDLTAPVEEILIQGDLTAVVPGRPTPELAELLALSSDVESRGAGLTVRFGPDSVRRALDTGLAPEELLARLAAASRTPVPQALDYLVADTGRRHGRLRVGTATSYLRTTDAAATRELLAEPRLAPLALREIAPTVLVSSVSSAEVLRLLRVAGGTPMLEGPGGVVAGRRRPPAPVAARTEPAVRVSTLDDATLGELVRRLRADHAELSRRDGAGPTATDPGHAVALLREAAGSRTEVNVVVVGPGGKPQRRRVRPVSIEGGRVRLIDLDRDAEIVVAVHRISSVGPLPG